VQRAVTCNAYALLVRESGQYARAAELIREAAAALERLEKEHPDRPDYWHRLPMTYRNLSQPLRSLGDDAGVRLALREAERFEAKLARFPAPAGGALSDEEKVIGSFQALDGNRLLGQGAEVERLCRAAQKKAEDHPDVPLYRTELAKAKVLLAFQRLSAQEAGAAQAHLRDAVGLFARLCADFPDVPRHRYSWADVSASAGVTSLLAGNTAEGEKLVRAGLDALAKLADEHPRAPLFRYQKRHVLCRLMTVKLAQGKPEEAAPHALASLALMKQMVEDFPACAQYRQDLAQDQIGLAGYLAAQNKHAEAEAALRETGRIWARAVADFPTNPEFRLFWGNTYTNLGRFLTGLGKAREADEAYAEAIRIHQRLVLDHPRDDAYLCALAADYSWRAGPMGAEGSSAESLARYSESIACLEAALALAPQRRQCRIDLQAGLRQRAFAYRSLNRMAEYERDLRRAEAVGERLGPALLRLSRARQRAGAGEVARALGDADDLFTDADLADDQWYELAELYAKLSELSEGAGMKERAAARSVEALGKALERGYRAPVPPAEAAAFRALAGRADFKKVAGRCVPDR
jgi:tetratricopeptide (TPR) repeat protein